VLIAAFLLQAGWALSHGPYYLATYNPLLGGGPAAAQRLPVGWGEGMDLVAQRLTEMAVGDGRSGVSGAGSDGAASDSGSAGAGQDDARRADAWPATATQTGAWPTVATPSVTLLAPLYEGPVVGARHWRDADVVVLYVDDVQIGSPDVVGEFYGVREPLQVVRLDGIDYAWIYSVED